MYILPVVLYDMETVTWKPFLLQKVSVFQNHIMRWICGKRLIDRTSIYEMERLTGLKSITKTIMKRKLKWFGHIKRSTLPVKTVFEGMVNGRRRRGRPPRRWRNDIEEWTGMSWTHINRAVHDRKYWRDICFHL